MTPLPNMAEVVRIKSTTTQYSKLLERFCAPYYSLIATQEYNRLNGTTVDSVFQKRYFSSRSSNGIALSLTPDNKAVNGMLKSTRDGIPISQAPQLAFSLKKPCNKIWP